jgi:putative hydrolase
MIECDLHVHSIKSTCGEHTLLEIVSIMRGKGIKGFALTDHGPELGTPRNHFSVMLRRMPPVIDGIRVFKGIESSVMDVEGRLDIAIFEGVKYEIVLAGLHPHGDFIESRGVAENTRALVNAMKINPEIKGITHPNFSNLPVDIDILTDAAAETNTALEINNSHLRNSKANRETIPPLLEMALKKNVPLMINSDGHMFTEMGEFEQAMEFFENYDLDQFNVVNRTLKSTLEFLGLEK